jgi:hypothetical protein
MILPNKTLVYYTSVRKLRSLSPEHTNAQLAIVAMTPSSGV